MTHNEVINQRKEPFLKKKNKFQDKFFSDSCMSKGGPSHSRHGLGNGPAESTPGAAS